MVKVKVAINGYGTIGKRVADAIRLQPDMELIGVAKTSPNYEAFTAMRKGYKLYTTKENIQKFQNSGINVAGSIEDMIKDSDIIIDATPGGVGANYKKIYQEYGKKAIFQGGEKSDVADVSFSALCNYNDAINKNYIRVVSCNTTGILRVLCTINNFDKIEKVRGTIVRRAADPKEVKKGPINSIVADPARIPSHHAKDVLTVLKGIDIITSALVAPTTLMHLHTLFITTRNKVSKEDLLNILSNTPRILLLNTEKADAESTAEIMEIARDLGRYRNDVPETVIFEDSIYTNGNEIFLMYGVHQESIVVPENIDAIRASLNIMSRDESIRLTNETLKIGKGYLI
ncbi:phosphorylating glyceraldehyde-3-phosphate dehydrogenase [Sulfolobus acidocaldarius]|uniref:Glyceraldehyde-3-phosphate dehydrogenase n=4 Tax=Sulfolobus acidocaldarius TaxID=2285 RepID=G3P_SULAC|nr:phosphorylating glyceraldehyde-3-phosphate dehydrogenase [Sulfolobus acidocaldarius]Q4J940.1 RecName: Full=Glyceraldehyde-3-phosphate dehydrogenase; Short=GAPDH; AltName: Full=NAD(P)-dependent glyceraldehyde-3-phosphate dehydrogenase [Sulfolobus acidocaldarius DSM 639]AAY80691.1 glyceraldehyde-3-phosphate dehydrogenase [Sulfolobus acidocaldarius DSM 639]AGE71288.1 glyceraldehyde-3-phosphate dehydrogenase [Sulfolobus acidocaldarius N8]AGE73557.1 glyceraldehyde-3-phosphate dehydrogenase [Sulfo